MTAPTRSEALQLIISDHLPAYLRLPSDFLVWTGGGEEKRPGLGLRAGQQVREQCQPEFQAEPILPAP